jgi:uncharacterized protein (UPF0261 family)
LAAVDSQAATCAWPAALAGSQRPLPIGQRQVQQNRLAVAQHHAVVHQHRHLAEGVAGQKSRRLVFALVAAHQNAFIRKVQQRKQQPHLMAIAGGGGPH